MGIDVGKPKMEEHEEIQHLHGRRHPRVGDTFLRSGFERNRQ